MQFVYDNYGNRTEKNIETSDFTAPISYNDENWDYTYDVYNRMYDVDKDAGNIANYTFNALGNRVMKYVNAGTVTTKMLYDGADCVADYDSNDSLLRYYITPFLDENLILNNGSEDFYFTHDGLGSVRQIIDSSQNTENDYDFYAYGTSKTSTENITNRFKFTGRELDNETASANSTALYYYRARTYDSELGSFTGRDPVPHTNLYPYCNNNPISFYDPFGSRDIVVGSKDVEKLNELLEKAIGYGKAAVSKKEELETAKSSINGKSGLLNKEYRKIFKLASEYVKLAKLFNKQKKEYEEYKAAIKKAGEREIINKVNGKWEPTGKKAKSNIAVTPLSQCKNKHDYIMRAYQLLSRSCEECCFPEDCKNHKQCYHEAFQLATKYVDTFIQMQTNLKSNYIDCVLRYWRSVLGETFGYGHVRGGYICEEWSGKIISDLSDYIKTHNIKCFNISSGSPKNGASHNYAMVHIKGQLTLKKCTVIFDPWVIINPSGILPADYKKIMPGSYSPLGGSNPCTTSESSLHDYNGGK